MSLHGVTTDPSLQDANLVAALSHDHIDRYTAPEKVLMMKRFSPEDRWIIVDGTYPDQIRERFVLLSGKYRDWVVDRLEGEDVRAAEIELRDRVVDYVLQTYPQYFFREGDTVLCRLTGLMIDVGPGGADPLVAIGLLATEDMVMMLPAEKLEGDLQAYRLKTGVLMFPNDWSLRSHFEDRASREPVLQKHAEASLKKARLGKTVREIHTSRVPHYTRYNADATDRAFNNLPPGEFFWRRNWAPLPAAQLSMHADMPLPDKLELDPDVWQMRGVLRSEQQSFIKLPQSGAIVFGIKTYMWPLAEVAGHPKAFAALVCANENLSPEMFSYRAKALTSFRQWLARAQEKLGPVKPSAQAKQQVKR